MLFNLPLALSLQVTVNDLFGTFLPITLFNTALALSLQVTVNVLFGIVLPITLETFEVALSLQFIEKVLEGITLLAKLFNTPKALCPLQVTLNVLLGIVLLAIWLIIFNTLPPF